MTERQQQIVLRSTAHDSRTSRMRSAAVDQVSDALARAQTAEVIWSTPWLGDEVSQTSPTHYTVAQWTNQTRRIKRSWPITTNSPASTTPSSAWRTSTAAPTRTRPRTCDAGHERRPLGGLLARRDLRARAAGTRAVGLRRRGGRLVHRREHHPGRRCPAHAGRQPDRRRLAGPCGRRRARRDDRDEQLGPRRRRRRDPDPQRHHRAGRAGDPAPHGDAAAAHRGVGPHGARAGPGGRAHVRDR